MNLKEAKVLMFDLDGTIIQNGCFVDNLVIETLTILKEKGYKLCVNSGRPHFLTLKVLDLYDITGLFDYIFGCNGAEFIDVKKDEYELISYLDKDIIKGKNILIVDDVITTCATINTCASLMPKAKNIYATAVARRNLFVDYTQKTKKY